MALIPTRIPASFVFVALLTGAVVVAQQPSATPTLPLVIEHEVRKVSDHVWVIDGAKSQGVLPNVGIIVGSRATLSTAAVAALANVPQASSEAAAGTQSADASQAGKALYTQVCQACHAAGVLNAPKFGDKDAWAPRLKEPMDTVYNYALHGKGAMPPKGGSNASDADVKAAVDYMVSAAK